MSALLRWVTSAAVAAAVTLAPRGAGLLASPSIVVEGTSLCPTPEAVRGHLQRLQTGEGHAAEPPASPPPGGPVSAELDQIEDDVRVLLRSGEETLAERRLQRGPCDDMALVAAVIISSWETELASGVILTPGMQPPPPPVAAPTPPPRVVPTRLRYEVALSAIATLDGAGFAPGGMLEGSLGLGRSPFWARLALSATGTRSERLGNGMQGEVGWTRAALSLGPTYVRAVRGWRLEAQLAGVAALLEASSNGLPQTGHHVEVDGGLYGGVRVTRPLGLGLGAFVGASVLGWLSNPRLRLQGASTSVDVPAVEGWLSLGVRYGRD